MTEHHLKNPVLFKETRDYPRNRGMKFHMIVNTVFYPLMLIIPFIFMAIMYTFYGNKASWFWNHLDDVLRGCFIFSTIIQFFYIVVGSTNSTLSAFTREKEQKTYDSLITTLMSPREIVFGKLFVGIYPIVKTLVMYSPLFLVIGLFANIPLRGLVTVFFYSLGLCLFCGMLGLFISAVSSTGSRAHNLATSILGGVILGTFLVDLAINIGLDHMIHLGEPFPLSTILNPGLGYLSAALWYCRKPENYYWYFWMLQFPLMLVMIRVLWQWTVRKIGDIPRT